MCGGDISAASTTVQGAMLDAWAAAPLGVAFLPVYTTG